MDVFIKAADMGTDFQLAPTDFRRSQSEWYQFSARNLSNVDAVIHEYVGVLWHHVSR